MKRTAEKLAGIIRFCETVKRPASVVCLVRRHGEAEGPENQSPPPYQLRWTRHRRLHVAIARGRAPGPFQTGSAFARSGHAVTSTSQSRCVACARSFADRRVPRLPNARYSTVVGSAIESFFFFSSAYASAAVMWKTYPSQCTATACADDEPPMATSITADHQPHYNGGCGRPQQNRQQQQQQQQHKSSAAVKRLRSPGAAGGGSKKKSSGGTTAGNRRRRLTHVLAGIVLGLFVGYAFGGGGSYDRLRLYAGCGRRSSAATAALRPLQSPAANFAPGTDGAADYGGASATESLLFVGVMTANRYLATRAAAVHNTWARRVPGRVVFYSSETSVRPAAAADLPLVPLPTVDDSYPPQKKSFLMLQHMWDNYGGAYEWFMRADDDLYVRPDRLAALLRSVDSRKPVFIGQAGRGNQEEFGLLSLEYDENFCMGGPGVIMSRETLARVVPHIKHCLKNLFTAHEDVELGRCVQKYAGVSCTWSYEVTTVHPQPATAAYLYGYVLRRGVRMIWAFFFQICRDFWKSYAKYSFMFVREILRLRKE